MQSRGEIRDSFKLLLFASGLTMALWFIPFAGALTYPIRLFVTFIHETGHALAALATSGEVAGITLDWNEGGLTYTRGGFRLFVSSAGYLGTILYGSGLLLLLRSQRNAKLAAIATGVSMLVITAWFGSNILAWLVGGLFGAGLSLAGLRLKPGLTHFLMSFLAIQCLLNAFYHLRALLFISAFDPRVPTDAANMSAATGGWIPPIVWAFGWSALSALLVVATLTVYYRSLRKAAPSIGAGGSPVLLSDLSIGSQPRL
jgi:hypothetical protein